MKNIFAIIFLLLSMKGYSQQQLFHLYTDSATLISDANEVVADFVAKVNKINSVFTSKPVAILNTQPYLIFYSAKTNQINLPIWHQVMQQQKAFFTELSGSKEEGEKVFGLFFNGFYLPHEIGHALQNAAIQVDTSKYLSATKYESEYFANTVAILYWKKVKRTKELEQCYTYAKKMIDQLRNPIPEGEDPATFFDQNYYELGADPYKYGYFQFKQFVEIYEDQNLADFDQFIEKYLF